MRGGSCGRESYFFVQLVLRYETLHYEVVNKTLSCTFYATPLPRDRAKTPTLTYDATRCLWLPTERAPTRLHTRKLMGAALVIAANRLDAAPAARGPSSRRSSGQLTSSYLRSDSRSREYARRGVGGGAARTSSAPGSYHRVLISFELHV